MATGLHDVLVAATLDVAPTGDENRLESVNLPADRGESIGSVIAAMSFGMSDIRTNQLAQADARRRRAAQLAERRPGLIVDGDASDTCARGSRRLDGLRALRAAACSTGLR